jgi:hypothetical protein
MADFNTPYDQVTAGDGADAEVNELFDAASPSMLFGRHAAATTGLTWGYYGGRWSGFTIANGTVSLTASATNYVTVLLANGGVGCSASNASWLDTANYARAYEVTTGNAAITNYRDFRAGSGGTINAAQTGTSSVGLHMVPVSSTSMLPTSANGSANLSQVAGGANTPDIITLNFANAVDSSAQFSMSMPKSWNEGTVTAQFVWSQASNAANCSVVWALQAVAMRGNSAIATTYGTAQSVVSNGGVADTIYVSGATPAITIGNTPQAEDFVVFRARRVGSNVNDNLAQNARLHGLRLFLTTDAPTDA